MGGKVVAIDIGSKNIHMAEGMYKAGVLEIDRLAEFPTPTNSFIEGRIEDRDAMKEAIRAGLTQNKIRAGNVILAVQGTSVITRELVLPEVKNQQLPGMIKYEMEQFIPDAISGYAMESRVLAAVTEDGVKKLRIRAAAMPKDIAEGYYSLIRELKLRPVALDIHLNAVSKLFKGNLQINSETFSSERTVALIDFGHRNTVINILSGGILEFSRTVSYGSRDLDAALAGYYDIPAEKAEQKKIRELQISGADAHADGMEESNAPVRPVLQQWTQELQKVLQYYASRNPENKPESIYLYGGGSRLNGLAGYLGNLPGIRSVSRISSIGHIRQRNAGGTPDIGNYLNALGAMIRL